MKQKFSSLFLSLTLLIIVFFTGCGSEPELPDGKTLPEPSVAEVMKNKSSSYRTKIKFKDSNGQEVFVIKRYSGYEKLEISYEGVKTEIKARKNEAGRIKYKESGVDESKSLIAKVKYKESSIKLVDENEKLLYKIKWNNEKVKISNDEEMTKPFELKKKSEEKVSIRNSDGEEIGKVKYYSKNGKVKVKDAKEKEILITKDLELSTAPGVILNSQIQLKLRFIIINELLKQGL
jgi:hypothetical protein